MQPIVTDGVAWSVGQSVDLSVMIASYAKTAELIELSFGLWTRVVPRNLVLDGSRSPSGRDSFWGKGRPVVNYTDALS